MMNTMEIGGYKAVIKYDPEIEMFRGEFIGINGSADFYASDIDGLKTEGAVSLRVFLEMCAKVPGTQYLSTIFEFGFGLHLS